MCEADAESNSETRIEVIERGAEAWRYRLKPVTRRKQQLRVHMAALGAPIANDRLYPMLEDAAADDFDRPFAVAVENAALRGSAAWLGRVLES